jgi:hypothetical protein
MSDPASADGIVTVRTSAWIGGETRIRAFSSAAANVAFGSKPEVARPQRLRPVRPHERTSRGLAPIASAKLLASEKPILSSVRTDAGHGAVDKCFLSARKRCTPLATHTVVIIRHEALPRCPTGKSVRLRIFVCPVLLTKIFRFRRRANQIYNSPRPVPQRGVAQRHERGAGCGGRGCAFGRRALRRTEKSCGPDAATLVSSLRMQVRRRRWQESPVAGYRIHTSLRLRVVPNLIRRKSSNPRRITFGPGLP